MRSRWSVYLALICLLPAGTALLTPPALEPAIAAEDPAGADGGPGQATQADEGEALRPQGSTVRVPVAEPSPSEAGPAYAMTGAPTPRAAPGAKELDFVCPGPGDGSIERVDASVNMIYTCPIRIYDNSIGGNQGWLFGNIRLHVDPHNPDDLAFFTLHGSATNGPSDTSRGGLTHSTFPSDTGGTRFGDEWTSNGYPSSGALGEWSSGTMDRDGNLYIAYTWALPLGNGYDYTSMIYKAGSTSEADRGLMEQYHEEWHQVWTLTEGNRIEQGQVVYVEQPLPETNSTYVGGLSNGTQNGTASGEFGDNAINETNEDLVAFTYFEQPWDWVADEPAGPGWIDARWTHTGPSNRDSDWVYLDLDERIGPCREASDPVAWNGRIYIACAVGAGYDARSRARIGDIDLWSIDPITNTTRYESHTGISGEFPKLAVTPDGYFAVVTSRVIDEQDIEVKSAMGWHGRSWAGNLNGRNLGPVLHRAMGLQPILDAHITAIAIDPTERTVFAVYKEWNNEELVVEPDLADPTNPTVRLEGYKRFLFSFNECEAPIAGGEFVLGTSPDLYQRDAAGQAPYLFNDRQDGLQAVKMPNGETYIWFAVNDYGAAQFGAARAYSGASDTICSFQAIPPPPAAPIFPQAISTATGLTTALGATLGVLSTAMIAYLVAARRRATVAATTKDE